MKKLAGFILIAFIAFSVSVFAKNLKDVKLLTNMTCAECKMKIEKALKPVKGVEKIDANVSTKVVKVDFDSDLTKKEVIIKTVKDLGYSVEEVKGEVKAKPGKCCNPNEKSEKK